MAVPISRVPSWISYGNPVAKWLLGNGIPMGPIMLLTAPGCKRGLLRTTPITLIRNAGIRGRISPFAEVHGVHNLRAAGQATIAAGRWNEAVTATELDYAEAVAIIREALAPHARRVPLGGWIVRHHDGIEDDHPEAAAKGRPAFELFPR